MSRGGLCSGGGPGGGGILWGGAGGGPILWGGQDTARAQHDQHEPGHHLCCGAGRSGLELTGRAAASYLHQAGLPAHQAGTVAQPAHKYRQQSYIGLSVWWPGSNNGEKSY